ncbi:MAG: hypothetical protein E7029_07525 [Planctomycetaceae bacterium]|nr:hypothetical protein [Planctomycetaceae bacterium]
MEKKGNCRFWGRIAGFFCCICALLWGTLGSTLAQTQTGLPNQHGQIWREYDISAYTAHFPQMSRPEAAVMDWILMETGFEVWHSEIPAMLNVTRNSVNVYHVPQVQLQVENVVQRFTGIDPVSHHFRVWIFTVNTPYWRQKIGNRMTPVPSFSMGSQAWTIRPDDFRVVMDILEDSPGFVNHTVETKAVPNGQRMELKWVRTRRYARNFQMEDPEAGGLKTEEALLDDGFTFELMPLLSADGGLVDAQIKFQINHLDRFFPMNISSMTRSGRETEKIEVPLIGQFRFRERYRWNTEKFFLLSPGLTPPLTSTGEGNSLNLLNTTQRVETLILIETRQAGSSAF